MVKKTRVTMIGILTLLVCALVCSSVQAEEISHKILNENNNVYVDADGNYCVSEELNEKEVLHNLLLNDNETLIDMGLTQNTIDKYRKFMANTMFKSAEEKYGSVTYTIKYYKDSFRYSNGITYLKTNFSWSWSRRPIIVETDIVAMTTSENFTSLENSNRSGHINYYLNGIKNTENKIVVKGTIKTANSGRIVKLTIPMLKTKEPGPQLQYALGGSFTSEWSKSGNIKVVGIAGNYGHSTTNIIPSVGVGKGGPSLSFTPEKTVDYGNEAYINISR